MKLRNVLPVNLRSKSAQAACTSAGFENRSIAVSASAFDATTMPFWPMLMPGDDFDGMKFYQPEFPTQLGQPRLEELTDAKRLTAERYAIFALAGLEAQRWYRASSVRRYHASSDYRNAVDVIYYFAPDDEELEAYLRLLRIRARNIVALPLVWGWIEAPASALMEKRTLSREDVLGIMQNVQF